MNTPSIYKLRRPASGFTLVELMVALVLSLLLAVAVLKMQTKMASQSVRTSDSGTRDTQARAALDMITRDMTSAGFLFGGMQYYCDALLTYNSGATSASKVFAHHPVDAVAAATGAVMPFAPSLTLNYPPAGSTVLSDVLVTMVSTKSTQFNDVTNPVMRGTAASAVPLTDGKAPMRDTTGMAVNDTAIVQAPLGNALACLRVPVSTGTTTTLLTSASGTTMPANFYTGFVAPATTAGFSTALSNVGIFNARVVDIGTKATSTQAFNVYYVDSSGTFPVLMRAQYSLVDDTAITAPQPIAAGVVALRVSYGVDPGNTGSVTDYLSSATVTASKYWGFVRSVRVSLVTRTINDDPSADNGGTTFAAPTSITIGPPTLPASSAWPAAIAVPASQHRFIVNTTEVAYRNWLWKN